MNWSVFYGILIPFLGTSFGAACVFFMKKEMGDRLQRMLTGFAAGVMVAAQGSGVGSCFFFCSTISSRICTVTARGRRDRKAS